MTGPSPRHMAVWLRVAREVATLSHCTRRQFGALVLDPTENTPLAIGYNGAARGGGRLCGGEHCIREGILSGERVEVGCHHAEANAIAMCASAARRERRRGRGLPPHKLDADPHNLPRQPHKLDDRSSRSRSDTSA